jgi:exonuclease III
MVSEIKHFITKQNPDILCLLETHTYYEDFSMIKGWLENKQYKVYYTAKSQKTYYNETKEEKIKSIMADRTSSAGYKEIEIGKWNANTYLHSLKYAGGVVVMVKSHLKPFFSETNLISDNRGISLHSSSLNNNTNTFLHFVYAPPQLKEAEIFWDKLKKNLNKKPSPKNMHYIIGDLNLHMNDDLDAGNCHNGKKPKAFKKLLQNLALVDTFRTQNKNKRVPTYFRVEKDKTVDSRVDYIFAPHEKIGWHSAKIYNTTGKISKDHFPVGIIIDVVMDSLDVPRPPFLKVKKMKTKNLDRKTKIDIRDQATMAFNSEK